jgi:hypothetical protein
MPSILGLHLLFSLHPGSLIPWDSEGRGLKLDGLWQELVQMFEVCRAETMTVVLLPPLLPSLSS